MNKIVEMWLETGSYWHSNTNCISIPAIWVLGRNVDVYVKKDLLDEVFPISLNYKKLIEFSNLNIFEFYKNSDMFIMELQ